MRPCCGDADARSVLRIVVVIGAVLLLAGCSGEEGVRAQALLQQAEAAQARLSSSTFDGSISFSADGQRGSMQFQGATSTAGEWLSLRATGIPGAGDLSMQLLRRGGRVWTNLGSGWQSGTAPAELGATGSMNAAAVQQLARYVKDVRVAEHQLVAGKVVTTIGGEIDTQAMVEAFTKLAPLTGADDLDLSKLGVDFGDIHVLLTIEERTHLLDTALISFGIEAEGQRVELELRYRLTSADQPVELPSPPG